jgi:AP-4 complex subunit mu-1
MISQLFILSPRGDVIIKKEYRYDVPKTSPETFFRAVRFWKDGERAPAVFAEDGVHYLHVKANGLFLATTTRKNVSPSHVLELLHRVAKVIKDYCGAMNEDALRKNSILAYELLDEMIDRGYAQSTSTEALKRHVFTEPSTPASATGAAAARASAAVKRASTPYGVFKGVVRAGIEYGKDAAAAASAPSHTPGGTVRLSPVRPRTRGARRASSEDVSRRRVALHPRFLPFQRCIV